MTDLVLLERQGEIAKVMLNQPAKLNAVNNQMWIRLREIFVELDADDGLRCVILAGSGERSASAPTSANSRRTAARSARRAATTSARTPRCRRSSAADIR